MNVMTVNAGGSSIKFSIIDTGSKETLMLGAVEGIGQAAGKWSAQYDGQAEKETVAFPDHLAGVQAIARYLTKYKEQVSIQAIGHRVAHGGINFRKPTVINDVVLQEIENLCELAPLHNPPALMAIRAFRKIFPNVVDVAVFDTGFHCELPPKAYTYGLPREFAQAGVRRFGFHGLAFSSMTQQAAQLVGMPLEKLKVVSLMLGSGTTANACLYGKSIDVSTGFTPMPGLLQSTRPGDFDPAILIYLQRKYGYNANDLEQITFKKSGWLGVSGISAGMKEIMDARGKNENARLAVDVLTYGAAKYVGAYMTAMQGMDLLVFGGGVAERSAEIRKAIADYFQYIGAKLDDQRNRETSGSGIISAEDSRIKIAVVTVREDLVIAEESARIIQEK